MTVELDETGNDAIDINKRGTNATTIPGARANLLVVGTIQQVNVDFTFASNGLAILAVDSGDRITQVGVEISAPFQTSTEITLGVATDTDKYLSADDIKQDEIGLYIEDKDYSITASDTIRIYLTDPSGSGTGKVRIKYIKGE